MLLTGISLEFFLFWDEDFFVVLSLGVLSSRKASRTSSSSLRFTDSRGTSTPRTRGTKQPPLETNYWSFVLYKVIYSRACCRSLYYQVTLYQKSTIKALIWNFFEKHRNFSRLQVLIHILFSLATRFIHKIDVVNDRGECGVKLIKK